MKKINIAYWITTGLLAALFLSSAIPNIMMTQQWVDIFKFLGYPTYLLPFLGVAKLLAAVAILVPGNPRLKEWAYAGITFDLAGALYSVLAVGTPPADNWLFLVFFALTAASYLLHHKRLKMRARASKQTPAPQPQFSFQSV